MDLGGTWRAAESGEELRRQAPEPGFDDSEWADLDVPGHWRSHQAFAVSDGPVMYRRQFSRPRLEPGRRAFLVFDGIFYQGDVWMDGEYLGDTEGYFFAHQFEVTGALAAREDHVLAVEVACPPPSDRTAKRALTGIFQHWDCIEADWNPGGIWAPVRIETTGGLRIESLKVLCPEAGDERAILDLEAVIEADGPTAATLDTTLVPEGAGQPATFQSQKQTLSGGTNTVRWRIAVEQPRLWWPRALGDQPLYLLTVEVKKDPSEAASDRRDVLTGLRQIRVRNFIFTVNGERIFVKGANLGPVRRALAEATPAECRRDVELAAEAGLDLLRVHAHISRPELYEAADRAGLLIWQDMPLQWGYGNVRRQAAAQARRAVDRFGHHPSIALWCGHNEPVAIDIDPTDPVSPGVAARMVAGQVLPTWNKTALDRSVRRALERADGSRPVVAHSGIVPHPAWGTDSHFYFGWYHGDERDFPSALARLPVLARFVSEFGAQAVPESSEFMSPESWPDLDWAALARHHCMQPAMFEQRVPPGDYPTFEEWKAATQEYQGQVIRFHIETLRRLKYRPTGGFCMFLLADAQPAVTWSVLDHRRVPKAAYRTLAAACAPVIVTCDRPAPAYRPGARMALDVHVVSDLRAPVTGAEIEARVAWPGGQRRWRFAGDIAADECTRVGRLDLTIPAGAEPGPLSVELAASWPEGSANNRYSSRIM